MNPYALGAVAGVVLLAVADSKSAPVSFDTPEGSDDSSVWDDNPSFYDNQDAYDIPASGVDNYIGGGMDYSRANLEAVLNVILEGESNGVYNALVGGGTFSDYSHHPGWTDASMTKKSAWTGWHNSHAAGGYQFQPGTWKEVSDALGFAGVFTPENQREGAIYLIKRRGAYQSALDGNMVALQQQLRNEWEFFQKWTVSRVISSFETNGGTLA